MQIKVIRTLSMLCFMMVAGYTSYSQTSRPLRDQVDPDGWAIGTNIGMTDMWGDVGTNSALDHYSNSGYLDKVCFMGGLWGRYTFHPSFSVRMMLNYGVFYATDKWNEDGVKGKGLLEGSDYVQRYLRSQTAKASVVEASFLAEYTFGRYNLDAYRSKVYHRGHPYVAAGLAIFHYTPYSTVANGTTFVKTYDLSLEGQGWGGSYPKKGSRIQPAIPIAIGYKWDVGEHLKLGVEFMYRITLFDYLDGVSGKYVSDFEFDQNMPVGEASLAKQVADKARYNNNALASVPGTLRGNPNNNDSYSSLTITFGYKVKSRQRLFWTNSKFGRKYH